MQSKRKFPNSGESRNTKAGRPCNDTFEELLDYAPELCVIVLPGGQITELVNTLLHFDGI
jgi:hypothetical protein